MPTWWIVDARRVVDRFEWAALARLAAAFTHEWSWAIQSADRLNGLLFFRADVQPIYLRVWVDDDLYGCPFLLLGERRAVNVPRATPLLLSGPGNLSPSDVIEQAWPEAHLFDCDDQEHHYAEIHERLEGLAERSRRSWGLTPDIRASIIERCRWSNDWERDQWMRALDRVWRGTWSADIVTYERLGQPIGWVCRVHREARSPELVAALDVNEVALPWLSPRLRQSFA